MEDNKYYTPDIEDIFIGYKCQSTNDNKYWYEWEFGESNFEVLELELLNNMYRTPYLTKEDIESEGWKVNIDYNHLSCYGFEKDNYYLLLNTRNQIPFIKIIYKDPSKEEDGWIVAPEHFQISIQCPSINELKIISKLLNIK